MALTDRSVKVALPEAVYGAIAETARRTGRPLDAVASEMLAEAVKMRRVPGIIFADGTHGRVVRIAGTGLEVWEIVSQYRAVGDDWEQLKAGYPRLSEQQLRAALAYAEAYPDEIDAALRKNDAWTPEKAWTTYPFMRPPWR
ncbi:MAG TPA: DUF433 domain-containing protein [Chloroflexota bacterium]|jgi:uncharacterized protein (DUF433 family)